MNVVRGLLERMLLVCAVVAGGLVPGFIAQYRQRLGGRLDQARLDLDPWQRLADQFYQGDLDKLIQFHLHSGDAKIRAEGAIIRALVESVHQLQSAFDALHGNLFQQAAHLLLHADPAIARATYHDWVPTFALSTDGILFALLFALGVWLLFQVVWSLLAGARTRLHARRAGAFRVRT